MPQIEENGQWVVDGADFEAKPTKCFECGREITCLDEHEDENGKYKFGMHLFVEGDTCPFSGKNFYQKVE